MWYLIAGIVQTVIVHLVGLHRGLAHMQYGDDWWMYVGEAVFYAFFWFVINQHFVVGPERERLATMREECSPEVYEYLTRKKNHP